MYQKDLKTITDTVSGERAFHLVAEISNFHRIQASTGYRAAAQHVKKRLEEDGLDVSIRSYPADGKTWFYTSKMFKEWDCRNAVLHLVSPARCLADFKTNPQSIIQRSYPCDFREQPLEIVLLDKGSDPGSYEDLDLQGKLIFVRDNFQDYVQWAVGEKGAAGIITDFLRPMPEVRTRFDLYDIHNYTSFWWKHTADEPQTFGFVLTPREGDWLAERCLEMRAQHAVDPSKEAYPLASGYVDAEIYNGAIEVVETFLPGETDEEVIVVAHLCHPRPSANDNASGVGAAMEALRVLKDLTENGKLAKLKRGIRMVFVPEFTGTYAYLHDLGAARKKIKAGINLDMVGARQSHGYGPLTLSGLPHATPSFVVDLAVLVLDEVRKTVPAQTKGDHIAMFNSAVSDIEVGSDHLVLSDPSINIPSVMLGQWPDLTYHTSGDTIEVIDPFLLHKSASICAGYAYLLANLSEGDVPQIMNKSRERFAADLSKLIHSAVENDTNSGQLYEGLMHYANFYKACNQSFMQFLDRNINPDLETRIIRENAFLSGMSSALWERYREDFAPGYSYKPQDVPEQYRYIPVRKYAAPIFRLDDYALDDEQLMDAYRAHAKKRQEMLYSGFHFDALLLFYIDGKRSLWEIAREAILETRDGSVEYVHAYVQLLKLLGLVDIRDE